MPRREVLDERCTACDTLRPATPAGWWGTALVVVCPRCVPLLTPEDWEELGATFMPLARREP